MKAKRPKDTEPDGGTTATASLDSVAVQPLITSDDHITTNPLAHALAGDGAVATNMSVGEEGSDSTGSLCAICMEFSPRTFICPACHFTNCHSCLTMWLTMRIRHGESCRVSCLDCGRAFTNDEVRTFCPEHFKRHMFFASKQEHRHDKHAAWCPNEDCLAFLDVSEQTGGVVTCLECETNVCVKCLNWLHEGPCPSDATRKRDKVLTNLWKAMYTKKCPGCDTRIQRNGGCTAMKCSRCSTRFCWVCRRQYNRSGVRGCRCSHVAGMGCWCLLVGGVIVLSPFAVAAFIIVAPPTAIWMTFSQKGRLKWKALIARLYADDPASEITNEDMRVMEREFLLDDDGGPPLVMCNDAVDPGAPLFDLRVRTISRERNDQRNIRLWQN